MRLHFTILIMMLTGIQQITGQSFDVNVTTDAIPESSFIGASTEFMYPILRGTPNEDTTVYDTIFVSELAIETLADINLNYLRFPGGTISQYYHYAGSHGYGTIDFDLDCREGYINIPGFKDKVAVDKAYPENMIDLYIELHQRLEAQQGNSIQALYVINIMSHIFAGDLVPTNVVIDTLIDVHGAFLGAFLDASPSFLTDELMDDVIDVMMAVYEDPLMTNVVEFLIDQEGFQLRTLENLSAIAHLIENDITIAGIELGNENYAYTMLKDDDLSDIPYDCTTPDSIVLQHGTLTLPLRTYMQAIIKYGVLTSIYDALIDQNFNIPTAAVINSTVFNVDVLELNVFQINEVKTEKYRYHEIWNKFVGRLNFYDAVIPHIYVKSQPKCDALTVLEKDSLEIYAKSYLDYYFTDILDYQLNRILDEVNNKPLWITEWNMNTANVFGNTFTHGSYVFQFMNEINRSYQDYNIQLINFHNLAAWRYNQFALIRTDQDTTNYLVHRQSVFEPFELMGELHRDMHALSETDMAGWLGDDLLLQPDHYFYSYFDEEENKLILHFINQSGITLSVPMDGLGLRVTVDGSLQPTQQVAAYTADYIDAESFLSSNEGCEDYPGFFDSYEWISLSGTDAAFEIPSYSLGRVILDLELNTKTIENESLSYSIHPNPASDLVRISYASEGFNDAQLTILDVTGRLIRTLKLSNNTVIKIDELPDGLYFFRLNAGGNTGVKKLVVKNRW